MKATIKSSGTSARHLLCLATFFLAVCGQAVDPAGAVDPSSTGDPTLAEAASDNSGAGGRPPKPGAAPEPVPPPPPAFRPAPPANAPRSVLALQTAAVTRSTTARSADGQAVEVLLVDLAPRIGGWYLLRIDEGGSPLLGLKRADFHLQVRDRGTPLDLYEGGVVVRAADSRRCALWGPSSQALAAAAEEVSAFARLCDGALYLRNSVGGHRTSKEWVTDFLRDRVPGGEKVISFVKKEILQDAHLQTAEVVRDRTAEHERPTGAPAPPRVRPDLAASLFVPRSLGIAVETDDAQGRILVGRWYETRAQPGIYVSGLEPNHVSPDVVREQGDRVSPLDEVEARALTYLVAFDLDRYELDFAVGTDHPRVGWSERTLPAVLDSRLPGPDGFDTIAPLARTGRIAPHLSPGIAATFIGGFKRTHSAFKYGRLAQIQRGSHYGFVEEGVILSSLQPELATVIVWRDGTVELKTWSADDDARLGEIRHARQNGVPIVETDPVTGTIRPGALVRKWGEGNWSGSQDQKFRTLRAGLCRQESASGRFLIYGYFSSVTTSAMARVFQAYGCNYAMLLDMNALEHTYLAVYRTTDGLREVQHLDRGMSVLDQTYDGAVVPRFLAYPDNRDFFYLSRRKP